MWIWNITVLSSIECLSVCPAVCLAAYVFISSYLSSTSTNIFWTYWVNSLPIIKIPKGGIAALNVSPFKWFIEVSLVYSCSLLHLYICTYIHTYVCMYVFIWKWVKWILCGNEDIFTFPNKIWRKKRNKTKKYFNFYQFSLGLEF